MNDLNSVLLEGTLTKDPVCSRDGKGVPRCLLSVASERYLKGENGMEKQTTGIQILTKGKTAEQCAKRCRQGGKIRAVGSLRILRGKDAEGRDAAQAVIDAEYVEIKPEMTAKQEKEPSHEFFSR
jgi:single-strand DNA-binding protein